MNEWIFYYNYNCNEITGTPATDSIASDLQIMVHAQSSNLFSSLYTHAQNYQSTPQLRRHIYHHHLLLLVLVPLSFLLLLPLVVVLLTLLLLLLPLSYTEITLSIHQHLLVHESQLHNHAYISSMYKNIAHVYVLH
jgi:hypothetical protein